MPEIFVVLYETRVWRVVIQGNGGVSSLLPAAHRTGC